MTKKTLLPRLAFDGIRKNGSTYLPYLAACIFAVFAYFVFDSILYNDIMAQLPKAGYAFILMRIGFFILGFILLLFLSYTNSFLIKRRGRELGLYSLLGLEKKHIGIMMILESLYMYLLVLAAGLIIGVVFARLFFLFLLNLSGLPVNVGFTLEAAAFGETALFWGILSLFNLLANLVQVWKSNPSAMMQKAHRAERETPKRGRWLLAVLGTLALIKGYQISLTARLDSMLFIDFVSAIVLVVVGTYFLFNWGSIVLLRLLKGNKRFYYRKENFITISGMYSRMKKNANSLVNICIFSTMVIITLLCTVSVYAGTAGMLKMDYPYDLELNLPDPEAGEPHRLALAELAEKENIALDTALTYRYLAVTLEQNADRFTFNAETRYAFEGVYPFRFIPLEDYNAYNQTAYRLEADEVLVFTTGADYGYPTIVIEDQTFKVKEELRESDMSGKDAGSYIRRDFYVVLPQTDRRPEETDLWPEETDLWPEGTGLRPEETGLWPAGTGLWPAGKSLWPAGVFTVGSKIDLQTGKDTDRTEKTRYRELAVELTIARYGEADYTDGLAGREDMRSMNGGLLFLGIFFSVVFIICMVLVMYYKQITEGFEDQNNYEIMRQVGMSGREVKGTIKKQVFMVFFIPLAGAVLHTAAGLPLTVRLLGAVRMTGVPIIMLSGIGAVMVFGLIYLGSYVMTARAYYRIVRKSAE